MSDRKEKVILISSSPFSSPCNKTRQKTVQCKMPDEDVQNSLQFDVNGDDDDDVLDDDDDDSHPPLAERTRQGTVQYAK